MLEQAVIEDDETPELMDGEPEEREEAEAETEEGDDDQPESDEEEAEELIVTIGEEPPPQEDETKAPEWLRNVRKKNREQARKIRELERQLEQSKPRDQTPQLGPKPTLESVDYDTAAFEKA